MLRIYVLAILMMGICWFVTVVYVANLYQYRPIADCLLGATIIGAIVAAVMRAKGSTSV